MGHVPWKELAVVGATTLGVCCAIGWLTGAENLQKKKKPQQRGPNGSTVESQECDALIGLAENAMKKGAYADVELAYLKALELSSNSDDQRLQVYPFYIRRRLVEVYNKMAKYDKCLVHLEVCIEYLAKKDAPSVDELQGLVSMIEQAVDLCTLANATPATHEKFLTMWLDFATKLGNMEYMAMASILLGKLNYSQEKFTEAEKFYRKATDTYKDPNTREELWLNAKTAQLECLTKLEHHEGAKQCIKEIADFLLNTDNFEKKKNLETLGDRCVFLGYYEEAENILRSAHSLMKRKGTPAAELAQVDHNLAIVWSATGRLDLAREKIKEMKEYLRTSLGSSIFPSNSKYLHTQGVKHNDEGTTITLYRGKKGPLKPGSVLVVKFEDPESETDSKEVEYTVQEGDETIKITAPGLNYSNYVGQIFSAEITIYTGADKTIPIGTHFVFIPSTVSSSAPASSQPPTVSIENILASDTFREQVELNNPQAVAMQALLRGLQDGSLSMDNLDMEEGDDGEDDDELILGGGDIGDMGVMGEMGEDEDEDGDEEGDEDEEGDDDGENDDEEQLVFNK